MNPSKPVIAWSEEAMGRYRGHPDTVRALVREGQVHRDVYIDAELFELEQEHFFANTWNCVGRDS